MRRPIDRIEVPVGGEYKLRDGTVIVCEEDEGPVSIGGCRECPLILGKRKLEYGMRCSDFRCGGSMRSDKKETHFKLK
jgi:hypothetical protein